MISRTLLTTETKNIMEVTNKFCKDEFKDTLLWDNEEFMPYELWEKMGKLGLTGMMLD